MIRQRLVAYRKQTEPLLAYYREQGIAARALTDWARSTRFSPGPARSWTQLLG